MYTWTSRLLLLFFTLSIFAPDYARAQALSSANNFSSNLQSSMTQAMSDPAAVADTAALQLQKIYQDHTKEILPLFAQFEDLETPISDITKLVHNLHKTAQEFETKQKPAFKNWGMANIKASMADGKYLVEHQGLPFDSFIDQMPNASSLKTDEAFLKAVEKYGDSLDIWFLVEYMDPLYQQHYNVKTVYYAASILSATVFQLNAEAQNTPDENKALYTHLLTRLAARVHYRLNRLSFSMNKEDVIMARGALRILDAHLRNGLKALGANNPYPYQWASFKNELQQFKEKKPKQSSTEYRTLLMTVELATTYALVTEQPNRLKEIVALFEAKPTKKPFGPGYMPTDYEKDYTEVIVQMYNTLFNTVEEGFIPAQTAKAIPNLLLGLADPSHATDVRVQSIFTAGFLNQNHRYNEKTGRYDLPRLLAIPKNIRQALSGYAADLIRLTYGLYYEDYGLKSDGMKALTDQLAKALDHLTPIIAAKPVWDDRAQKELCDLSQKIELERIPSYHDQYWDKNGKTHYKKACIYTSNYANAATISLDNDKNIIAVDREQRDMGARFLFDWILFDLGIFAIGKVFTFTAGAARFLPASIRAANAASKGSKMTRFFAKLNQGVKYGTKSGFASKLAKEGFILTDMKTVKTARSTANATRKATAGTKVAGTTAKTTSGATAAGTSTTAPAVTQTQTITTATAGAEAAPTAAARPATTTTNFTFFHNNGVIEGKVSAAGSRWSPLTRAQTEHAMHGFVSWGAPVTTPEMNMAAGNMLGAIVQNPSAQLIENFTLTPEIVQGQRLAGFKPLNQIMDDHRIYTALKETAEANPVITISEEATLELNADQMFSSLSSLHQKKSILTNMNTAFDWQATKVGKFFPNVPPSELGAARDIALADVNAQIAETYDFLHPLGFQSNYLLQQPVFQRVGNISKWAGGFAVADMSLYGPAQLYTEYQANADLQRAADKVGLQLPQGQGDVTGQNPSNPQDVHSAITSAEPQTFEGSSLMIPIVAGMSYGSKLFGGNGLIKDNQITLLSQAAINQQLGMARQKGQVNYATSQAQQVVAAVYTKYRDGLVGVPLTAEQQAAQKQVLDWMGRMEQDLQTISGSDVDAQTKINQIGEWINQALQQEEEFNNNFPQATAPQQASVSAKATYQEALQELQKIEQYSLPRAAQQSVQKARAGIKRIYQNKRFSEEEKYEKIVNTFNSCMQELERILAQENEANGSVMTSDDADDEMFSDQYNSGASSMAY